MYPHFYAIGIFLSVALMNACVKGLDHHVPVALLVLCRSVMGLALFTPMILKNGGFRKVLKTDHPYKQVSRGFLSVIGVASTYYAIPLLPLGDSIALWQTYGFFVLLLSVPILGEKIEMRYYVVCALGFLGVVLIAQPHGSTNIVPVLIMVFSALAAAITTLTVRLMSRQDKEITILTWFFGLSTIISTFWFVLFSDKVTLNFMQIILLLGAGVCGSMSQFCMTKAFKSLGANIVGSYAYSGVLFSMLIGFVIFGEIPSSWMIAGAALILIGIHFSYRFSRSR